VRQTGSITFFFDILWIRLFIFLGWNFRLTGHLGLAHTAALAFESIQGFDIGRDLLPHVCFGFDLIMSGFGDSLGRAAGYTFAADSLSEKKTIGMVVGIVSRGGFNPDLRHHRSDPHGFSHLRNIMKNWASPASPNSPSSPFAKV